jgi:hypothetical protein
VVIEMMRSSGKLVGSLVAYSLFDNHLVEITEDQRSTLASRK